MSRFAIDRLALGSLCSTIIAIAGCGGGALPSPALDAAASFDFAPLDRSVPLDLDEPDLAAPPDLAEPDLTPVACASDSDCGPLIDGGPVAARCCGGYCVSASDPANCGACGVVCGSGRCGSALSASMATQPDNWSWNGDAFWDALSGSTFLTDMSNWEAGTVVYQDPIAVDAFDVRFDFLM